MEEYHEKIKGIFPLGKQVFAGKLYCNIQNIRDCIHTGDTRNLEFRRLIKALEKSNLECKISLENVIQN